MVISSSPTTPKSAEPYTSSSGHTEPVNPLLQSELNSREWSSAEAENEKVLGREGGRRRQQQVVGAKTRNRSAAPGRAGGAGSQCACVTAFSTGK